MWYEVQGTGGCISIKLSSGSNSFIGVYTGTNCDSLACEREEIYGDGEVSWISKANETYRVSVGNVDSYSSASFDLLIIVSSGIDFFMRRSHSHRELQESDECSAASSNDDCSLATDIDAFPFAVEGDLSAASTSSYQSYSGCGLVPRESQTLWWRIPSTSNTSVCLTADVLFEDYESGAIAVYQGDSCNLLFCETERELYSEGTLSFVMEPGVDYYMVVASFPWSRATKFTLEVRESFCPANDRCSTATNLADLPAIVEATGGFSTSEPYESSSAYSCSNLTPDLTTSWYQVEGTGECMTAFVSSLNGLFLAVYEGEDCTELSCVAQESYGDGLKWFTQAGATYWILVGATPFYAMDFSLAVAVRANSFSRQAIVYF